MTTLSDLLSGYKTLTASDRLHMRIRWQLCPMQKIASYVPASGVVIDLGCGHGLFTQLLARDSLTRDVIGIDLDAHKIAVAEQLTLPNVRFVAADIADAALPSAQAVTILDVFYLVPYAIQEHLLEACAARLAADGAIVLKESAESPRWKMQLTRFEETLAVRVLGITENSADQKGAGVQFYFRPRADWQALLHRLGFEVETIALDRGYYIPHVLFIARKRSG